MRNSYSDSHLDRPIKKEETNMGDYDETHVDNSAMQNSTQNDPTDIETSPLTEEEFSILEASLDQGKLVTTSNG